MARSETGNVRVPPLPMLFNYNHLYYFHLAAIEGSVAGAATRLGVTQPTVSEQVRALEQALGVALFERTTMGLRLTASGRLVFVQTTRMFCAGEELTQRVSAGPAKEPEQLRIGVSVNLARSIKSDFLLPLMAQREWCSITRTGESVELLRTLREGGLDLVFCEQQPSLDMRRGLAVEVIDRTDLVAVAPPEVDPAAGWSSVGLVQFRPTSPYWWPVVTFLESRSLHPRIVAESDDALFLVEAAIHHQCLAVVPATAAEKAVANGKLRVLERVPSADLAIHALFHDNTFARRAISRLLGDSG